MRAYARRLLQSHSMSRPRDIIAVIGTTGVGKSQLAISLAKSLKSNGHNSLVLSADSMQLYKGLDVITNKATVKEMDGVEHWGLGIVTPGLEKSWEMGRWCVEAGRVVDEAHDTMPIICGGTHYFIQHFLFPPPELDVSRSGDTWTPPCELSQEIITSLQLDREMLDLLNTFYTPTPLWPAGPSTATSAWTDTQLLALHRLLTAVCPQEAARWHWRDGRKVKRGLERWWEGQAGVKSVGQGRRARFRTLMFWVHDDMETLRPRLDRRVDTMVKNGLLREIAELREIAIAMYGSVDQTDHTEGIFQSIGYKEFAGLPLDGDPTTHPQFESMLDRMKLSTHQYAKSQISWIRKQLLPAVKEARDLGGEVWVYVVKGGEVQEAERVLKAFINGQEMPESEHELLEILRGEGSGVLDTAGRQQVNTRRDCEVCSTTVPYSVMVKEWDIHVKSKGHRNYGMGAEKRGSRGRSEKGLGLEWRGIIDSHM